MSVGLVPEVRRHRDGDALAAAVADELVRRVGTATETRGRAIVVLAGGRTPRGVYERLARAAIDWARVVLVFGDERAVPPDDPGSNHRMVHEALLSRLTIAPRVLRMRGELGADAAAADYAAQLAALFDAGTAPSGSDALFDVVLLGVGDDAHVASVFPATAAAHDAAPGDVIATTSPVAPHARVSLTLARLGRTRALYVLATGVAKARPLATVYAQITADRVRLAADDGLPAARVARHLADGAAFTWHLDDAAAADLPHDAPSSAAPLTGTQRMNDIGVIGLGVMGRNLAWNMVDHGFKVAVWNREPEMLEAVLKERAEGLDPAADLATFVQKLEAPRCILLMITAGKPVDMVLEALAPLLQAGDIVIDGGNSWFEDTRRREAWCTARGLSFVGMGVSGGEDGARFGPSLMPGGKPEAWARLKPVLEAIAAKTDSGPCVTHVGPDGAGHFVKMVHNGIEYADMQLIAEAYDLLRRLGGLDAPALAEVFARWNEGPLESFLIDITAQIFRVKDPRNDGDYLVDKVLDQAGSKGTGKWTVQVALDLAVAIPSIAAALDARVLSSMKPERVAASRIIAAPMAPATPERDMLVADVHDALLGAKVLAYAQGMALVRAASDKHGWGIGARELARIWKGGCIIRARFLDLMMRAYDRAGGDLPSLLHDPDIRALVAGTEARWRRVAGLALASGIPVPAMTASLAWYDSYRTADLPQNLTQAQRDAFGSHTFQRADAPAEGFVHHDWLT